MTNSLMQSVSLVIYLLFLIEGGILACSWKSNLGYFDANTTRSMSYLTWNTRPWIMISYKPFKQNRLAIYIYISMGPRRRYSISPRASARGGYIFSYCAKGSRAKRKFAHEAAKIVRWQHANRVISVWHTVTGHKLLAWLETDGSTQWSGFNLLHHSGD